MLGAAWKIRCLPPSRRALQLARAALPERQLGADDVFLVNSTSGTTGLPKCVLHNQNRWMFFHQLAAEAGRFTGDDVFFSATGISDGDLLKGVRYWGNGASTQSMVMRSKSGTIRTIDATHQWQKLMKYSALKFD